MRKTKGKKFLTALLAGVMALNITACGGKGEETAQQKEAKNDSTSVTSESEFVYVPTSTPIKYSGENTWIGDTVIKGDKLYYSIEEFDPNELDSKMKLIAMNLNDLSQTEEVPVPKLEIEGYSTYMNGFQMDDAGNFYAGYYVSPIYEEGMEYSEEDTNFSMVKFDKDGNQVYQLELKDYFVDENNSYIQSMVISKEGKVFASSNNVIYVVGADGAFEKSISAQTDWINGMVATGDGRVFYSSYDNQGSGMILTEIDTQKNAPGEIFKNIPDTYGDMSDAGEGKLLVKGNSHLYEYDLTTQKATPLFSWIDSYLTCDFVNDIVKLQDGNFVLFYQDWNTNTSEVVKLTKTKASDLPEKETLVLATLFASNSGTESAIVDFNKNSTKYKIKIKSYYDDTVEWTEEGYNDAIKLMNADFVSDNPPDIIDLSNTNINSLVSKGALEDLTPYLEKSTTLKKEDFLPSVLNAYTYQNKLVTIPRNFMISTLIAKKSLVGEKEGCTIEDLIALSNQYPDAELMAYSTKESVLHMLLYYNNNSFIDYDNGTVHFDSPEFIKVLEFANQFSDEVDYEQNYPKMLQENKILLGNLDMSSAMEYQMYHIMMEEPATNIGYPTFDGSQGVFMSGMDVYAISAQSTHKEGAWEFMESYLGYRDNDMNTWGFSCRLDEMEEQFKEDMTPEYGYNENGEKIEYPKTTWGYDNWQAEIYAAKQEDIDAIKKLIEIAKPIHENDEEMYGIIQEEAAAYFKGQKSAQDVAKIIQSRASIFVSENN